MNSPTYKNINGFLISEEDQSLLASILPEHIIATQQTLHESFALRSFQNQTRELLHSFLNGSYSSLGYFTYPFTTSISAELKQRVKVLDILSRSLIGDGHDLKNVQQLTEKPQSENTIAELIGAAYTFIGTQPVGTTKEHISTNLFDVSSFPKKDNEYVKPLLRLRSYVHEHMHDTILECFVHGSFGTKDYIKGWSDLDTLTIIRKESIEQPAVLVKLRKQVFGMRRFFYAIDPLQHHGTIMVSEHDLDRYCNAYFPLSVLSYGQSILRKRTLDLHSRSYHDEALQKLFWVINYFRHAYKPGLYEYKNMLSQALLMPSLYLTSNNVVCYKKYSFEKVHHEFKGSWGPIQACSEARARWKPLLHLPFIQNFARLNPVLPYMVQSSLVSLVRKNRNAASLHQDLHQLMEEVWSRVIEHEKKV